MEMQYSGARRPYLRTVGYSSAVYTKMMEKLAVEANFPSTAMTVVTSGRSTGKGSI